MIHVGDALTVLRTMPDESVHCVVTSPPYWGLRDYGTGTWEGGDAECDHIAKPALLSPGETMRPTAGPTRGGAHTSQRLDTPFREVCGKCGARRVDQQLGLERTPSEYLSRMVEVFREVRRVLRIDGTCWVNMGDSYNSIGGTNGGGKSCLPREATYRGWSGLKPKDLCGIPWRLALALQADGWYLRADIIWHKPNPMPESVTDRPTKAHEYVFLLSKSARYFWDAEAIREECETDDMRRPYGSPGANALDPRGKQGEGKLRAPLIGSHGTMGSDGNGMRMPEKWNNPAGRNARSVWTIATQPFPEAHFATFPEALAERCIRAGTSDRGCCPECGAPWVRVIERGELVKRGTNNRPTPMKGTAASGQFGNRAANMTRDGFIPSHEREKITTGFRPSCSHDREPVPCTVLDPFGGAGTVGLVAAKLNRAWVLIELKPEYAAMAERRIRGELPLFVM